MALFRVAVLAVCAAVVLVSPTVNAQRSAAQARDDDSSYGSYQPVEEPQHSYAPQPQPQYMIYPAAPFPSYHEEEEEKEAAAPKEDKKCAVRLVLPPLIIITIFIGLILAHLVSPTLFPAFVDPFVLPLVAIINAVTGLPGAALGILPALANPGAVPVLGVGPGGVINIPFGKEAKEGETSRQKSQLLGSFDSLLHMTAAVTAAVDDEVCFARLLCQAGTTLPKESTWNKSLKYLLPKQYQPYVTIMEKASFGGPKTCAKNYPCPQLD